MARCLHLHVHRQRHHVLRMCAGIGRALPPGVRPRDQLRRRVVVLTSSTTVSANDAKTQHVKISEMA